MIRCIARKRNIEPVEQLVEVDLRKRRLRLKDEIAKYLAQV
jgi:uncharacterized protein YdcH (DUF465 family)